MSVGRNASCPCGSGMKFKHCCADKSSRGMSKGLIALLVVIGAIAAIGVAPMIVESNAPKANPQQQVAAPRPQPKPQPAGQAPPGKVWSEEHGHWHDAAPAAPAQTASPIQIEQSTGPARPTGSTAPISVSVPQPPGEAPPGKVWSPEHGHWHDKAPTAPTATR